MRHKIKTVMIAGMLLASLASTQSRAGDVLLLATKPNLLHVVDVDSRRVVRTIPISEEGPLDVLVTPRDGKIGYVLTNHVSNIVGIDLKTGKVVFQADMSDGDIRVRGLPGFPSMTVSPDGRYVFVYQMPTRLLPSEYEVLPTRIAVYRTDAGLNAKPVRLIPAPRRIKSLLVSPDSKRLYALGIDISVFDVESGKELETIPVYSRARQGYGPKYMSVICFHDFSDVCLSGYEASRKDQKDSDEKPYNGLIRLDVTTGQIHDQEKIVEAEQSALNPVRRNEAYGFGEYPAPHRLGLFRTNLETGKILAAVELPHPYNVISVSSDGREIYLAGSLNDIAIYDSETLERLAIVALPGGGNQVNFSIGMSAH